jgi:hypothetical protein
MKQILLIMSLLFCSCTLFKKTSRTSDITKKTSLNQLEFSQLVLKKAGKETQIFTYWNDSGFYQYQVIKEQIQERASAQLKVEEKEVSKEKQISKKSEPVKVWGYILLLIALFVVYFLLKKFRPR